MARGLIIFVSRRIVLLMIERDAVSIEKNEVFCFKQEVERPSWPRNKEMMVRIKTIVTMCAI